MGGGVAMRAAAKVAGIGVLNSGLRGVENPVASAARQATRSVTSVVNSSDDLKLTITSNDCNTKSSVEKPYDDDWEFAGVEDELFVEAEEPLPRLVFGGAPTIHEAKQATSDLNSALEKTYLLPNANNNQNLSDSGYTETKQCLVSETLVAPLASKHAIQAFRLLNENPKAQTVVASIASDPNVWNAVMQNPDLVDFLQTHKTDVSFEMDSNVTDEASEATSESKSETGKGLMDYMEEIKQKITVTVVDMVNSLSDTFQTLFGGSPKDEVTVNPDGTAGVSMEQTAIGASLMGLAIMVISVIVLKRSS